MKRWLCMLLILMLLTPAALAEDEAGREVISSKQMGSGSVGTEEDGPFGRYAEPLTVTCVKSVDAISEQRMKALEAAYGETWEDNRWTRAFQDELNVEIKYLWMVDNSQFVQKWKMSMASGDLPDLMAVDLTDLNQLAQAGLIQNVDECWEQYASDLTRTIVNTDDGDAIMSAIHADGQMMGVPEVSAALDHYRYLWVRTDWLDALKLNPPKTTEDLMKVWEAFCTQDPDGNGEDDTYAFMLTKDLWYQLEGLFWGFGAYPDTWVKDQQGKLVYGATLEEMKAPLKFLQEAFAAGYIDPEFTVKDYQVANELVAAGKTGMEAGGHWLTQDVLFKSRQLDPTVDWGVFEWPTLTGEPVVGELELGLSFALAVNKDFENPEVAVKMLNVYYEKLYGETGDYAFYGNDAGTDTENVWNLGPMASFHPLINMLPYRDACKVVAGEMDVSELKGASLNYWNNSHSDDDLASWYWKRMWMPGEHSAGDLIEAVIQEDRLFTDYFVGAPTETMVERFSSMQEMQDTTFTKMIIGELDVDQGFDSFVESWYKMGGDKITEEVNAWYAENVLE